MNTTPPSPSTPLPCPRCKSNDTKFCYYNNYNLMQPRHFCRTCRRYWTHGGTLRNVPVGGGSRKTKQADLIAPEVSKSKSVTIFDPSYSSHNTWNPNPNPNANASFQILNPQISVGVYNYFQMQQDDIEDLGFDREMDQYELDPLPESLSVDGSQFGYWK